MNKAILFWISVLPLGLLLLVIGLILSVPKSIGDAAEWLCDQMFEVMHAWEAWCFDYKTELPKQGLHYRGGGIWSTIPKGFLPKDD